ncbi:hypothetical protein [Methanosphaera sp.]
MPQKKLDPFEERQKKSKAIHDELIKKGVTTLNKTLKSEEYKLNNLVSKTSLGSTYHDLIDPEDKINSKYQRKYNEAYHAVDVELYKINRVINQKERMINYEVNKKTEQIFGKIKNKL